MTPKVKLFLATAAFLLYCYYCVSRHVDHHAWEPTDARPAQTVVQPPGASFSVRQGRRGPVLAGELPGEAAIGPVLARANSLFGVGGFEDRLHGRTVARAAWVEKIPALLDAFRSIPRAGGIWVRERTLVVSGEVPSEGERNRVVDRVHQIVGGGLDVHDQLVVAPAEGQ